MDITVILQKIKELEVLATEIFSDVSDANWKKNLIPAKWSMADQQGHLLLSAYQVTGVYKQPDTFFEPFGSPPILKRSYEDLFKLYQQRLADGQKATPDSIANPEDLLNSSDGLDAWKAVCQKLINRLNENWTEERLDKFVVPHPALGLITTRELLFFQIFHSNHHLEQIAQLKKLC